MSVPNDDETLIAMLDRADFERARLAIDGFGEWESFDDYRSDREGRWVGLAFAGQSARLTPVSISAFLVWCASNGLSATSALLDEFVEFVDALSRDPNASTDPFLPTESIAQDGGPFGAPFDSRSYREWLACLGAHDSVHLLNDYAALVFGRSTKFHDRRSPRQVFPSSAGDSGT